jgi:prepilin peptidase dependent protein B
VFDRHKRVYRMLISRQAGLTLIEILIALAINAFVFVVLIAVFVTNLNHYHESIEINRLNDQLQTALQLMSDDIRRAGYWANANTDIGLSQNNNPFQAAGVDLTINGSGNCILFAYDHNANGSLAAVSSTTDDERYGYRLSGSVLQARPPGAAYDCTASAGAWENMTDTNVLTITALTFTPTTVTITTGPGTKGVSMRSIDISLTGQLTSDASISKTVSQHVRIRNDKFIP